MPKRIVLLFLSVVLFFLPVRLSGIDSQEILNKLSMNEWESGMLNDREVKTFKDKSNFDNLMGIIDDHGVDWRIKIRGIKLLGKTGRPCYQRCCICGLRYPSC